MRIRLLGGLKVEHDGQPIVVTGAMQLAVFFRLAVDAGRAVTVREIVEDVWSTDAPENEKAALQSVISRLRSQLPAGVIESTVGGYRLLVSRTDVDALDFSDRAARGDTTALALWVGEPWIPSQNFDWFERDLRRDHATLAATRAQPSAIPAPLTSLIGRDVEFAMIAGQFESNRLVTIVGTGGAGKTRLAIETARARAGSLLVELAPVGPGEVLGAVLTATGRELRTESGEVTSTRTRVIEALYGKSVTIVLDNCEHVIDEAAAVASDLLATLPSLRILATSREPLAIAGEAFVAVGSLPHPREGDTTGLLDFAAVELFRQRASAARGVDLTEDEIAPAAQITTRLDGLPLAIELAAAKLRTMSVDEVLVGLEDRFALLTGGFRTALPRHQTLRAMIDWSWSLLDDDERATLAQLAVFPSGVAANDAPAVAALLGVRDSFESLVDRSLLQRSRGRYRTLETIREYGLEKLAETGRTTDARALQARHQAEQAVAFDARLRGPGINEAISWFDAEEDNISAALRFAVSQPEPQIAVSLVMSCTWYWIIRDREADSRLWFPLVVPLAESVEGEVARYMRLVGPVVAAVSGTGAEDQDPAQLVAMLAPIRDLRPQRGSHELLQLLPAAIAAFGEVMDEPDWMIKVRLPSGEDLGLDEWPTAVLHVMSAAMAHNRGEIDTLGAESALGVEHFERIGDFWGLAVAQQMRSEWLSLHGRLDEALEVADASTENMRRITTTWDLAQQRGLGITLLLRLGRVEDARDRAGQMIAEAEQTGNVRTQLQAYLNSVTMEIALGDIETARHRIDQIEAIVAGYPASPRQMGAWIGMAKAGVAILAGELDDAAVHLRAAAEAAFASYDLPVISHVAVTAGTLAAARGDLEAALRAVDLAAAVAGIRESTDPHIAAIDAAARAAGIERPATEVTDRSMAMQALRELTA